MPEQKPVTIQQIIADIARLEDAQAVPDIGLSIRETRYLGYMRELLAVRMAEASAPTANKMMEAGRQAGKRTLVRLCPGGMTKDPDSLTPIARFMPPVGGPPPVSPYETAEAQPNSADLLNTCTQAWRIGFIDGEKAYKKRLTDIGRIYTDQPAEDSEE